jgi:transglutaminase-like putative cysteine protease
MNSSTYSGGCVAATRGLLVLLSVLSIVAAPSRSIAQANKRAKAKPAPSLSSIIDPELKSALAHAPKAEVWPNSDAALLLDTSTVTIKPNGTVVHETRSTYKLFNERARSLAEVSIGFNAEYENVEIIKARTISRSGVVKPLNLKDVHTVAPYSEFAMYDDSLAMAFSLPAIEDGCVIDYVYRKTTLPFLLPGHVWFDWRFNGPRPVGVSRLTVRSPLDRPFSFKRYNGAPIAAEQISHDDRYIVRTWEMKDIAPIEMEPDMPGPHEIAARIECSSLASWNEISQWFWRMAKPQMASNDWMHKTVLKLTAGKKTDEEKARAIYDWTANKVRYVAVELGISAFKPHAAKDVYDHLYGDCKDKSTLLISLLKLAGISADPVLLHTEDRMAVRDEVPSPHRFNHCIVLAYVGDKQVWLDPTAEDCGYGDIPGQDRGSDALVVREGKGDFVRIPTYRPEDNGGDAIARVKVSPNGAVVLESDLKFRGALGQFMRQAIRSLNPEQIKQMTNSLATKLVPGGVPKSFKYSDPKNKSGDFTMSIAIESSRYAQLTGNLMLVPWYLNNMFTEKGNPYTKETRTWPIVSNMALSGLYSGHFELPEGYSVQELPKDCEMDGRFFTYKRHAKQSENQRTVDLTVSVVVSEVSVPAADYGKVRTFFDDLARATTEQIILKRTN